MLAFAIAPQHPLGAPSLALARQGTNASSNGGRSGHWRSAGGRNAGASNDLAAQSVGFGTLLPGGATLPPRQQQGQGPPQPQAQPEPQPPARQEPPAQAPPQSPRARESTSGRVFASGLRRSLDLSSRPKGQGQLGHRRSMEDRTERPWSQRQRSRERQGGPLSPPSALLAASSARLDRRSEGVGGGGGAGGEVGVLPNRRSNRHSNRHSSVDGESLRIDEADEEGESSPEEGESSPEERAGARVPSRAGAFSEGGDFDEDAGEAPARTGLSVTLPVPPSPSCVGARAPPLRSFPSAAGGSSPPTPGAGGHPPGFMAVSRLAIASMPRRGTTQVVLAAL